MFAAIEQKIRSLLAMIRSVIGKLDMEYDSAELPSRAIARELELVGASAAIAGGALRIVAAFVPYDPQSIGLELLYGAIDLGLLFGLAAVYLAHSEALGRAGMVAFLVAAAGIASVVGPDAMKFGIDFYLAGSAVFIFSLLAFSVLLLVKRIERIAAACWTAAGILAIVVAATGDTGALTASGVALGAGFIAAGWSAKKPAILVSPTE